MTQLIVATSNEGKLREIAGILEGFPLTLRSLWDIWNPVPSIPETGATFEENAALKAEWVFGRTGQWTLADDSGLEVDYLQGAPGVYSARYAGENAGDAENMRMLLDALAHAPETARTARFRCVMVLITGDGFRHVAQGVCEGHIGFEPAGENGFGYDPVFIPAGFGKTFAQLDSGVKHAISHRGKALRNLRGEMVRVYGKQLRRE